MLSGLEELGKRLDQEMSIRQTSQQVLDRQLATLSGEVGQFTKRRDLRRSFLIAIAAAIVGAILTWILTAGRDLTTQPKPPTPASQPELPRR